MPEQVSRETDVKFPLSRPLFRAGSGQSFGAGLTPAQQDEFVTAGMIRNGELNNVQISVRGALRNDGRVCESGRVAGLSAKGG